MSYVRVGDCAFAPDKKPMMAIVQSDPLPEAEADVSELAPDVPTVPKVPITVPKTASTMTLPVLAGVGLLAYLIWK